MRNAGAPIVYIIRVLMMARSLECGYEKFQTAKNTPMHYCLCTVPEVRKTPYAKARYSHKYALLILETRVPT